ncbi:hypothetical protein BKA93DRAFT_743471, partial [Sparassis latifolia]
WKSMSKEEQEAATEDEVKALDERRSMRAHAEHNVPLSAFNDARMTMANIEHELVALHDRTGTEVLMFAVRSDINQYNQPFIFYSNLRLSHFIATTTKCTVQELAMHMEGYCISRVEGKSNYVQEVLDLKKKTSGLIMQKLSKCGRKCSISRMVYLNFDTQITAKFGVVIENWPLPKFCCPGDVGSHTKLEILFGSWESGRTCFRSMPDEEWMQWLERRSRQVTTEAGDDQEDTVRTPTLCRRLTLSRHLLSSWCMLHR